MPKFSIILTNKGKEILVDSEDFDWLNRYKWHLNEKGYAVCGIYDPVTQKTKKYRMNRMIMGFPKKFVDHKDRDKLNNRRNNLRLASRTQNGFNSKMFSTSTTGLKWICWDKSRNQYHVSTKINQRKINVGRFDTLEQAKQAVREKILPLLEEYVGQYE